MLFTEEEWNQAIPEVVRAMTEYVRPFGTPVSKHHGDHGEPWGSGSYLQLGDRFFILTNQHVAAARNAEQELIHQMHGSDDLCRIVGDHAAWDWPLDLAILPAQNGWTQTGHQAKAIASDQIAITHDPAPTEILTFYGFSGERGGFHFGTLINQGTCSTSREITLPADERFNSRFHFGLDYRPDLATTVMGTSGLPCPPGFSGSVVWNTGFVEARLRDIAWKPDMARVTGVIWGWLSAHGCLVATRAEFVRSFLFGTTNLGWYAE